MISDNTIIQLQAAVETKPILIGGKEYATRNVYDPRTAPHQPKTLTLHSLTSLVDYVKGVLDQDKNPEAQTFIHITGPDKVAVRSSLFSDFQLRDKLVEAVYDVPPFPFDKFLDVEAFIIGVTSRFVDTTDRKAILALVGNLQKEKVVNANDDGFSQKAVVRRGVSRLTEVDVQPIVHLAPFRTFTEIDQPISPFLLRLISDDSDNPPKVALFEADGGMWENEARQNIKTWLTDELSNGGEMKITVLA